MAYRSTGSTWTLDAGRLKWLAPALANFLVLAVSVLALVLGCASPTEVWMPCDVEERPDYCAGPEGR